MNNSLQEIASRLRAAEELLLTAHILPDGDSVGSLLGLGLALRDAGCRVTMFSADEVPVRYRFLKGADSVVTGRLPEKQYDCVISLDCSDHNRLRPIWDKIKDSFIVNIDHHATNRRFGKLNYVDSHASATGEIVFALLETMGLPLTEDVAAALYVAISTDTGSFKFESTTPDTHRIAARLLEAGAKPKEITPIVFDMKNRASVFALREALNTLTFTDDGKVAWLWLTEDTMAAAGALDEDLEGIVNYAKNIEGVEIGLFFREKSDGTVKIGFRSHNVDVGKLAEKLGGGGHARAAGCSFEGNVKEAVEAVVAAVRQELL